ncbi:MAG: DNA-3-methyladenine glycosylase I [Bacteroidales bacterium]|nr:DNA-3-methyladenine glycosylase I [Bacteroidales bacterium]
MKEISRCGWSVSDPVYIDYHDRDWGVPVREDPKQFEFLVLESAQAGLSWLTILKRREGYRRLYAGFDVEQVARFDHMRVEQMMQDTGIIRNRKKIESSINNAQRFLEIQDLHGTFCSYLWGFVEGKQVVNHFKELAEIPATTPLSDTIAKDLKQKGFRFLGSTIIYAHLQATGLVNDHLTSCFRHRECIVST